MEKAIYKPLTGMEDNRFTIGKTYVTYAGENTSFVNDDFGKEHKMTIKYFQAHFQLIA